MAVNNSLVGQKNKDKEVSLKFTTFMASEAIKNKVNSLVAGKKGESFISSIVSAVQTNLKLAECDNVTILNAALLGESLDLSPSPQLGQYYLVPFNDTKNNRKVATFILGYKGYIQLATRSGFYKKFNVVAIKEGELIKYDPLEEEIEVNLIEDEELREKTETIGYYVMFEYHNGFRKTMYWSRKKMELHADKYSPAFSLNAYKKIQDGEMPQKEMWKYSSYWYSDFDNQAYKTMIRQIISKWGIMSIEFRNAIEKDMSVIQDDGSVNYVHNIPVKEAEPVEEKEPTPQPKAKVDDPLA